jgi:hypothetical protein
MCITGVSLICRRNERSEWWVPLRGTEFTEGEIRANAVSGLKRANEVKLLGSEIPKAHKSSYE